MSRQGGKSQTVAVAVALLAALALVGFLVVPMLGEEHGAGWRQEGATSLDQETARPEEDVVPEKAAAVLEPAVEKEELLPYGDPGVPRERSIRGKVTDREGEPVADAITLAAFKDTQSRPWAIRLAGRVRTREDGTFILGPLPRRNYFVIASHKDKGIAWQQNQAPGAWLDLILIPGARITGTVTAAVDGKPVEGVRILVKGLHGQEAVTDRQGSYELSMVPPSTGWQGTALVAVADDYQRQERTSLVLKSGDDERIDFSLVPGGTLKGRVVHGETLQPMKNAIVAEGWESYHKTTRSKEDGTFVLDHVDSSPNRVFVARSDGFASQQLQSDGSGKLEFKLSPSLRVFGKVLDPQGHPAVGARVKVHRTKTADGYQTSVRNRRGMPGTPTDAEGRFEIEDLVPGSVVVIAFHDTFAPAESEKVEIPVGGPEPQAVTLNLKNGAVIEGLVRGVDGQPAAGERVYFNPNWNRRQQSGYRYTFRYFWREGPRVFSDAQGRFVLDGLMPGKGNLMAGRWGRGMAYKRVEVAEGERLTGIELSFAGVRITGVVLDGDENPVAAANVWASTTTQNRNMRSANLGTGVTRANAQTDSLGRFVLTGLREGTYNVGARDQTGSMAEMQKDISTGTEGLELRFKATQVLRLSVDSAVTNRPLRRFTVWIMPKPQEGQPRAQGKTNWSGTVESPDGRFERLITPGIYNINIKAEGHAPQDLKDFVVEEGVDPNRRTVTLEGGASIQGIVRDAAGQPLPRANVQLQPHRGPNQAYDPMIWSRSLRDQSDHQGRYFLQGAGPGTYILTVNMGKKGRANAQITVQGQDTIVQDIQILPTGTIQLKVTDEEGNPIPKVYFSFTNPAGGNNRWLGWAQWTNNQGITTSSAIRQGQVRVTAYHNKKDFKIEPFEVTIEPHKLIVTNVVMQRVKPKKKPEDGN